MRDFYIIELAVTKTAVLAVLSGGPFQAHDESTDRYMGYVDMIWQVIFPRYTI